MSLDFIIAAILSAKAANTIPNPEHVNRFCSAMVGIPYASDNFSDDEWERFKVCREVMGDS